MSFIEQLHCKQNGKDPSLCVQNRQIYFHGGLLSFNIFGIQESKSDFILALTSTIPSPPCNGGLITTALFTFSLFEFHKKE